MASTAEVEVLCRACLVADKSLEHYTLSENIVHQLYTSCTNLEIANDDTLTKSICSLCYTKCVEWNNFKEMCVNNEKILRIVIEEDAGGSTDFIDADDKLSSYSPTETYLVSCTLCDIAFEDEALLSQHMRLFHCDEEATTDSIEEKSSDERDVKPLVTDVEPAVVAIIAPPRKRRALKRNLRNDIVPVNPATVKAVPRHNDSELNTIKCQFCQHAFTEVSVFEEHVDEAHLNELQYNCKDCNYKFKTRPMFKNHMYVHSDFVFRCENCNIECSTLISLLTHRSLCKTRSCDICGHVEDDPVKLRKHRLGHSNARPYGCKNCGTRFSTRDRIESHQSYCNTSH